jgi:hypothetical protein
MIVELVHPLRDLIEEITRVFQLVAIHQTILELLKFLKDHLAAAHMACIRFLLDQVFQPCH